MKNSTLKETLYSMFTENTGSHICDSGDVYGRNWQRNQKKTIQDFDNSPSAHLELELSKDGDLWCNGTISTWHHLNATLELDEICQEFNSMDVENWDSDAAYGLSSEGEDYLNSLDAEFETPWNTCNWENNFDQVLQGCNLEINGESYVLIQYHGGCDVRGGYTDAKLFKIGDWYQDYFLYDDSISGPYFEEIDNGLDVHGLDMVDHNSGGSMSDELIDYIIKHYNLKPGGDSVEVECSACEY